MTETRPDDDVDSAVDSRVSTRERRAAQRLSRPRDRSFWVRSACIAFVDALGIWVVLGLVANESWAIASLIVLSLLLANWAYLNPRAQASRWLTPGLVLMAIFVVYPVLYTAYLSFTNYQTGNLLDRDQAIERLEDVRVRTGESGATFDMVVYRDADGLALLVDTDPGPVLAPLRAEDDEPAEPIDVDLSGVTFDEPPERLGGYELLNRLATTGESSRLTDAVVDLDAGRTAEVETLGSVRVLTGGQRFVYDAGSDTVTDLQNDLVCPAGEGTFYCDDVPRDLVQSVALLASDTTIECADDVCDGVPLFALDQSLAGWREVVGFDNYAEVFTNERIRAPFLRVLVWNIVFSAGSVFTTFALGLGLALALKDEKMRWRSVYRSIYIIPYAVPAFLSILVWRGLLDAQFGKVNELLSTFGLPQPDWLGTGTGAMAAIFLVNLWLGFPYMFLIASGALTSIPEELIEAARVDGAGPIRTFRMVVLPLLLVSTAPLLIGAFAFNFNNFVLIYLLTDGGPPLSGYDVPVGSTDILISFTFDIAQGSGRGSQYALATAIVMIIFLVLATTSALSFRLTKKLEEIYDQ